MRHSSRIKGIIALLALMPVAALAGPAAGPRGGAGIARGLLPVHPVVGSARGLSPVRPMVGQARGLSPIKPQISGYGMPMQSRLDGRRQREAIRRGGYQSLGYGAYGYGDLDGGVLGYGTAGLDSMPTEVKPQDSGTDGLGSARYPVFLPPPSPCVRPQIIRIGRSSSGGHAIARRSNVRVVYGAPPCGAS